MFSTSSTYNPQLHMSFPISPQMNNPISFKSYMKLHAQVKFAKFFSNSSQFVVGKSRQLSKFFE
jgi:hypothetical protein